MINRIIRSKYIRTADRLQRTAPWLEEIEGGLEHVRAVILDDSLGIAADLDAAMAAHVASYSDEWRDVLEDPVKLARFTSFVNAPDAADDSLAYVYERGQRRPATPAERASSDIEVVGPDGHPKEPVLLGLPRHAAPTTAVRTRPTPTTAEQPRSGVKQSPPINLQGEPR